MYYIGLDVPQEDDQLLRQGCEWSSSPGRKSWSDTVGTGQLDEAPSPLNGSHGSDWIYDHLLPHATQVKVAHPLMLRAIAAATRPAGSMPQDRRLPTL